VTVRSWTHPSGENHRPAASHWQTLSQPLYTSPWSRFELTISVVIGIEYIVNIVIDNQNIYIYRLSSLWIYYYFEYVDCNIWFIVHFRLAKPHSFIRSAETHFSLGDSPTFAWMQRHDVNYYKGEQIVWNKTMCNSLNTPIYCAFPSG
jgi:hypothetical protein